PFTLVYRWSVPRDDRAAARRGGDRDAAVDAWSAVLRDRLVAVRPVEVETLGGGYSHGEVVFDVPGVEVYFDRARVEDERVAIAPPWSTVPWHVLALMDEAARRGIGAFSQEGASAHGVPWLDLVRDPKQTAALAALADELRTKNYVPPLLAGLTT